MAAVAILDNLEIDEDKNGKRAVVTYRVNTGDLSGSTGAARAHSALSATGVPALGATFAPDTALTLERRRVIERTNVVDVICEYQTPSSTSSNHPLLDTTGVPRFRGGTTTRRTTKDNAGAVMVNTWTGTRSDVFPFPQSLLSNAQIVYNAPVEVDIQSPSFVFDLTTRVTSLSTIITRAQSYVGYVNSTTWTGTVSFPARTCLCLSIDLEVVKEDEWRARHTFEYNPNTHDYVETARVEGRIPMTVNDSNGIDSYRIYPEADFNAAALTVQL